MKNRSVLTVIALIAVSSLSACASGSGDRAVVMEPEWDVTQAHATRADLEAMLARYEQRGSARQARQDNGSVGSRSEAQLIRNRLESGDFSVGDRIDLVIEGESELSGEYTVQTGQAITIPTVGRIPVQGVLRSELNEHLEDEIGMYLRDPVVYSESTMRIAILGGVGSPGYYDLRPDALVSDALMTAGGPTRNAQLRRTRIERRNDRIWSGEPLQQAIAEGRTIDQLSVRTGDRIEVPEQGQQRWVRAIQYLGIIGSAVWGIERLLRVF